MVTKRPSSEWQALYPNPMVIERTGWDGSEYSWNVEPITLEEYQKRVMFSKSKEVNSEPKLNIIPLKFNIKCTESENREAAIFRQVHNHSSKFSYIIDQNSGIGRGISIRCEECYEEKDITDYDCW